MEEFLRYLREPYQWHLETMGESNSHSKTDPDALMRRMRVDATANEGYNVQIATEKSLQPTTMPTLDQRTWKR